MLDHASLGVADLDRAAAFYDAALAPLGYACVWRSETGAGYGPPGGEDGLALFPAGEETRAAGRGFHLALTAPGREAVDGFHAAALRLGGTDLGGPGLRPRYGPGYYAAFVLDPDGHKLEAVFHEPG